jgi:hypothetical protein
MNRVPFWGSIVRHLLEETCEEMARLSVIAGEMVDKWEIPSGCAGCTRLVICDARFDERFGPPTPVQLKE